MLSLLDLGDRQCAYISAMQVLLTRAGIEPHQVLDALTTLPAQNLCGDAPIRLVIVRADGETPPSDATKH